MVAAHVHDAIAQVRRLQNLVLARKNLQGYSGTARLCGALLTQARQSLPAEAQAGVEPALTAAAAPA